ncbi:MAG TPA: DUF5591 domain-containing protein [Candidatus Lokiarchaeia archaeon]|nr:DUF5591 domain-containing protein [Candidatus Lokiarchaeia archaeon]
MPITFNLDRMQGLSRSGVLRDREARDFKEKTPLFIPRIHISLLRYPAYAGFLADGINRGKIKVAALPRLTTPDALPGIIMSCPFLENVTWLVDQDVKSGEVPSTGSRGLGAPFYRPPIPDASIDAGFSIEHATSFLQQLESLLLDTGEPAGIALRDHGFPDVLEMVDTSFINARAWALTVESFNLGGMGIDALVRKAIALHQRFRLDIFRVIGDHVTPHQLAHAVAAGFDGMLEAGILTDASRGKYYTPDTVVRIQDLTELPCNCPHCQFLAENEPSKLDSMDKHVAIYLHDMTVLMDEMSRIRQLFRLGRFRDHFETRDHGSASLAAFQKKLDARAADIFTTTIDLASRASINFIGQESYTRPEIIRFRNKISEHFHFPPRTAWIVLLPCSAHKPYSDSPSHAKFLSAMSRGFKHWRDHCSEIIITSPIGVIPRQLEHCFPAAHYDVPVTGYWDEKELSFSARMLEVIINKAVHGGMQVHGIIAHLDGGYRKACELAEQSLPMPVTYTGEFESATSRDALMQLEHVVESMRESGDASTAADEKASPQVEDLRVLVDYQLETLAGATAIPDAIKFRPIQGGATQVLDRASKLPLLIIDGFSGHVSFEKAMLAKLWAAATEDPSIQLKKIQFCDRVISGSNLFPGGIETVDDRIAAGDDVFIHDSDGKLLAQGIAIVPGSRMKEMKGGAVVSIAKKLH